MDDRDRTPAPPGKATCRGIEHLSTTVPAPLAGLTVVEVAAEVSVVGAGLATSLPGSLLRDLGAEVLRVRTVAPGPTLDDGLELDRPWTRGKQVVEVTAGDGAALADVVTCLATRADVMFLAGDERSVERNGLGHGALAGLNERLVTARIRPSVDAHGSLPDHEVLLHARSGLLTQVRGNRPGPVFCPVPLGAAGAGLAAAVGALALLYEREGTGRGGWVETSLYDGLLALLPMIVGRVEHDSPSTTLLWRGQGPSAALTYRCADGEHLQLWFGAKGAYEAFLAHIGDPPSEAGYTADTVSGAMGERSARWAERFATRPRAFWLDDFAGQPFRCEPVLRPGEALADPHVREIGLSVEVDDPARGPTTVLGPVARVVPSDGPDAGDGGHAGDGRGPLLSGVRVLDLSAYLAGPVTPQVLAELGADVVKVEPATGDVHRNMEPLFAAGQRGKRAVALDLKHPEAAGVLGRLFCWSDVVHHNARVGLDARLGYDEGTVRAVHPSVVYSHASGFGAAGPRATLAANDHLMQALCGVETAMGGVGAPPSMTNWGAIDVTGGWLSAVAVLAGLCARRRTGRGQTVSTSLLGAGLLLTSGAFLAGGAPVEGPLVAADQTGYGAAYRLYEGADGAWFAVVVPDQAAWTRLRDVLALDDLSERLPALRTTGGESHPDEARLVKTFSAQDAATWVEVLRRAGVPVEPVLEADRSAFVARLLDDPVNRQLGRVTGYEWGDRGRLDQPGFPLRTGPAPRPAPDAALPRLGEHTAEVLAEVGLDEDARARLVDAGVVAAPAGAVAGRRAPSL